MPQKTISLLPPLLSEDHVDTKIICIRAHRERIFALRAEILKGRLICHNYGQGGAGWTFLFGCVNESIRQFEQQLQQQPLFKNKPITVIGAGCYGLLTAIMLAKKGYDASIIAQEMTDISSYKAAGFFFPRPRKSSTAQETAQFESTGMESYRTYLEITNGKHPFINQGPKLLPAYYGLDIDPGFSPYIAQGLIQSGHKVTIDFGNQKIYEAIEYQTIFINPTLLMHELQRLIQELKIPISRATVNSFEEIGTPIVFNCAGLGAKALAHDVRLIPVQGHLITLKNQSAIEQLQYMINFKVIQNSPKGTLRDELIYFAPKDQGILGITFIRGQDSLHANQHEFDRLLERSRDFFGT